MIYIILLVLAVAAAFYATTKADNKIAKYLLAVVSGMLMIVLIWVCLFQYYVVR